MIDTSGRQHVGGVEPPAHPRFDRGDVNALPREPKQPERRHALEERRRGTTVLLDARRGVFDLREQRVERAVRDVRAVDLEPLVELHEVRGGVEARFEPRRLQHRGDERRDRALAVRPRDVHDAETALGVAETFEQRERRLETGLDPERAPRENPFDSFLICHGL